jgi:hypothetical protein
MVRYLVYANGGVHDDDGGTLGLKILTESDAVRVATALAKKGLSAAVFKEISRYDPAEPVRSEPR